MRHPIVFLFTLPLAAAIGLGAPPSWALDAPDPFSAVVTKVVRRVDWQRAQTSVWQRAGLDTLLMAGDSLRTGGEAKAELLYGDGSVTRVGSLTSLRLTGDRRRELRLDVGTIWLHIRKGGAGMRIHTPGAVATVTGTELLVSVDPVRRATEVTVFEGAVNVNGDIGELVRVIGGTTTRVPFQAPAPAPVPLDPAKLQQRSGIFKPLSVEASFAPVSVPSAVPSAEATTLPAVTPVSQPGATPRPEVGEGGPAAGPSSAPTPPVAPPPSVAPVAPPSSRPDLKGQTDKLLDPRVINGSPTTGSVKVIIE